MRLSLFLTWGMMMILCGRCGASDASGSFSRQAQYFVDVKNLAFQWSCLVPRVVFGENLSYPVPIPTLGDDVLGTDCPFPMILQQKNLVKKRTL